MSEILILVLFSGFERSNPGLKGKAKETGQISGLDQSIHQAGSLRLVFAPRQGRPPTGPPREVGASAERAWQAAGARDGRTGVLVAAIRLRLQRGKRRGDPRRRTSRPGIHLCPFGLRQAAPGCAPCKRAPRPTRPNSVSEKVGIGVPLRRCHFPQMRGLDRRLGAVTANCGPSEERLPRSGWRCVRIQGHWDAEGNGFPA